MGPRFALRRRIAAGEGVSGVGEALWWSPVPTRRCPPFKPRSSVGRRRRIFLVGEQDGGAKDDRGRHNERQGGSKP